MNIWRNSHSDDIHLSSGQLNIDQSALCFHSTIVGVASNVMASIMAETVMMETTVVNIYIYYKLTKDKKKEIVDASTNTRDCIVVLSTELLLYLTTPVRHFRIFNMNITVYLETLREAKNTARSWKAAFDWSIQRSQDRPPAIQLVQMFIHIN